MPPWRTSRPIRRAAPGWSSTTRTRSIPSCRLTRWIRSVLDRFSKGGAHRLSVLEGLEHMDGDVCHPYLIVLHALTFNPVVDHDVTEGASRCDARCAGGKQLLAALHVDLLADVLLH